MTRTAYAILRKDLRIEVRTKESVPAMALFSVTVFVPSTSACSATRWRATWRRGCSGSR